MNELETLQFILIQEANMQQQSTTPIVNKLEVSANDLADPCSTQIEADTAHENMEGGLNGESQYDDDNTRFEDFEDFHNKAVQAARDALFETEDHVSTEGASDSMEFSDWQPRCKHCGRSTSMGMIFVILCCLVFVRVGTSKS